MAPIAATALVALATGAHAVEQQKFESLHRAAAAIEAAAPGNGSYDRFSALARTFAEALLSTKDAVETDEDQALLMLYAQAGLAYGDSLAFLRQKVRYESPGVPSGASEIAPLVTRYSISTRGDDVDVDSALTVIWKTADEALRKAELLYEGRYDELAALMGTEARADTDADHQRELIDRVAKEFAHEESVPSRPRPYEEGAGNWTCPRGYVVQRGECLSDADIARRPKVEVSE